MGGGGVLSEVITLDFQGLKFQPRSEGDETRTAAPAVRSLDNSGKMPVCTLPQARAPTLTPPFHLPDQVIDGNHGVAGGSEL